MLKPNATTTNSKKQKQKNNEETVTHSIGIGGDGGGGKVVSFLHLFVLFYGLSVCGYARDVACLCVVCVESIGHIIHN